MATIEIEDDCFAPYRFMWLKFKGKDPWSVAKKIEATMKPFFHVSTSSQGTKLLLWDVSSDPITFQSIHWFQKPLSAHTMMRGQFYLQGGFDKTSKEGNLTVKFEAFLDHKFSGWRVALYPVWYMYSYLFYNRIRRNMIEQCRDIMEGYRNSLKEHLGLKPSYPAVKSYE